MVTSFHQHLGRRLGIANGVLRRLVTAGLETLPVRDALMVIKACVLSGLYYAFGVWGVTCDLADMEAFHRSVQRHVVDKDLASASACRSAGFKFGHLRTDLDLYMPSPSQWRLPMALRLWRRMAGLPAWSRAAAIVRGSWTRGRGETESPRRQTRPCLRRSLPLNPTAPSLE